MEDETPQPIPLEAIIAAPNLADLMDEAELSRIGDTAVREYEIDKASMSAWFDRMKSGVELATLVKGEKQYPFENAANIKYPLITTAALQFNAKAYPAIVASDGVVKVKVYGSDPQGIKAARGERVSAHMSWQLSCAIEEWEEDTDGLLTVLPIVGSVFRKVWRDTANNRTRVRSVAPGKMIVNDRARSLIDAPRLSEEFALYPTEIAERVAGGTFRNVDMVEVEGNDPDAPQEFIEQHRRLDLDGDGYAEPYVVTVHAKSRKVARIVADFDMGDVTRAAGDPALDPMTGQVVETQGPITAIRRGGYYVHYRFLPSLDGGLMGSGLGLLLGDINETVNSVINMMLDAGHMASRGGGFIGQEFRIKGGSQQFKPGEWKLTQAAGGDIRSAIVPMTFPGPDATLFQLLGLLIEAGKDVSSVKDVLTGETGGRNMTATTTLALIEQGMAQFTAAYKRIFRALKHEFRLIARINAEHVSPEEYNRFHDAPVMLDPRMEYDLADMDITPVADPTSVTRMQSAAKAELVMQAAMNGMADPAEASKRIFEAASIPDVEALMPKPDPMAPVMAQMQMQGAQAALAVQLVQVEKTMAEIAKLRADATKSYADAAATEVDVRLGTLQVALETMRADIAATVARSLGGLAGAPGNGAGPGGFAPPVGPGAGGGDGGLLGGQPMVGSGPGGFAQGGSAMGGPVPFNA
jgi:chaperonin GroES